MGALNTGALRKGPKILKNCFFEKSMLEYVRGCRREDWCSRSDDDDDDRTVDSAILKNV